MKQNNFMERVENYLNLYDSIIERVKDERVAMTILQEVSKDRRMDEIGADQEARNGEPATRRQLAFLESLGVEVKGTISKRRASELIDEALGKE